MFPERRFLPARRGKNILLKENIFLPAEFYKVNLLHVRDAEPVFLVRHGYMVGRHVEGPVLAEMGDSLSLVCLSFLSCPTSAITSGRPSKGTYLPAPGRGASLGSRLFFRFINQ